jgi:hypothetical protein
MLRPLDKKGERRRDSDLHPAERANLQRQKEKADFYKRNPHLREKRK